jgi:hypothetical protein
MVVNPFYLARPVRLERTTNRFEVCDSIRLSYGRMIRSHAMKDLRACTTDEKRFADGEVILQRFQLQWGE